jgi:hypothetical protein
MQKNRARLGEKWRNPRAIAADNESMLSTNANNNNSIAINLIYIAEIVPAYDFPNHF